MAKLRAALLVLQCAVCLTIRVPVDWDSDSDINDKSFSTNKAVELVQSNIPKEYFQYTAVKPQFAVDIAASHGVKSPEKLYSSYPITPYTGIKKPYLGQHHLLNPKKEAYLPYQNFVNKSQSFKYVNPTTTSFEVYHPYKFEEPYLQEIYKDPILNKIRDDLRDSQNRLQKYETDAGESNLTSDEYLEGPGQIDLKHQPQKNVPAKFEIHIPMRQPTYYRPPMKQIYRENILDNKFKHPLNQNFIKVSPMHYRPIKNHLQHLRQQHALKFDDERNEYPQLLPPESYAERPDGYDIYEKGKENYIKLRNNLDESINKATLQNRPLKSENLELQNNDNVLVHTDDDEFVPIKNYAQVRKTETTKHLPRERAFLDADNYDEIKNAPRLREAIKSTKAQIVYSEEGYEDSAYDHAGEQKHASDHEEHGGHLKENEHSKGKYKIPSVSTRYDDEKVSAYRDQVLDGKKWQDSKKASEDEADSEDYSEEDHNDSSEIEIHADGSDDEIIKKSDYVDDIEEDSSSEDSSATKTRNKRQDVNALVSNSTTQSNFKTNFNVPKVHSNLNLSTKTKNISSNFKLKYKPKEDIKSKYPYYFTEIKGVSKDSPLRYAENLKLIPKKSHGGTEFYESRSKIACPEIEEEVDPIPDALKKGENPGDNDNKEDEFKKLNKTQRLKGLGDKIDCFKAKYFGANPLDSPFFKEEIILSPKPVSIPNISIINNQYFAKKLQDPTNDNVGLNSKRDDIFTIIEGIYGKNNKSGMFQDTNVSFPSSKQLIKYNSTNTLQNIKNYPEDKVTLLSRNKRANHFIYEPYKIIKEGQIQDSKKITTTNNVSPLIKQLQSSRGSIKHNNKGDSTVKRNTNSKIYQDVDHVSRQKFHSVIASNQSHANEDKRRGEPRYDNEHQNHKAYYTPVENKAAVTLEEYEEKTGVKVRPTKISSDTEFAQVPSYNDARKNTVLSNTPQKDIEHIDIQYSAASNTIKNVLRTTTSQPITKTRKRLLKTNILKNNEEFEENVRNDDKSKDKYMTTTTKPTTTKLNGKTRVSQQRYVPERIASSTDKSIEIDEADYVDENSSNQSENKPKLELVTRFRQPTTVKTDTKKNYDLEKTNNNDKNIPNYREKKKKLTKSTLVTDTKTYGEDDDDMRKEDMDSMIGIKHDMDDYMPSYEKTLKNGRDNVVEKVVESGQYGNNERGEKNGDDDEEEDEETDDEDNDDTDDDDTDDIEDDEDDDDDDEVDDDEDDDFDDDDHETQNKNTENPKNSLEKPTPTNRIPSKVTETTISTTQATTMEKKPSPNILRKKIEIHKELPINKSSPNLSQFKQDIKEIEIIKEMHPKPRRKHQKISEVLELYKDDNLAKDINKLGGVEIFNENLNLKSGPRHGGNYRSIDVQEKNDDNSTGKHNAKHKLDIETSQTETKKRIDSSRILPFGRRHINRKPNVQSETSDPKITELVEDVSYIRRNIHNRKTKQPNEPKNAKLTELVEEVNIPKPLHGGNLKLSNTKDRQKGSKNEKYIELDDEEEENTPRMHGGNFKSYGNKKNDMHGGNYKSAKIVQESEEISDNPNGNNKRGRQKIAKDEKINAAAMLSGFARAVPILTTTPVYILDPSKRMYYYVDT